MWVISEVLLFIYGAEEGKSETRLPGKLEKTASIIRKLPTVGILHGNLCLLVSHLLSGEI